MNIHHCLQPLRCQMLPGFHFENVRLTYCCLTWTLQDWSCGSPSLLPISCFRFSDTFDHWRWVQIWDFQTRIIGTGIPSAVIISLSTGQKRDLISAAYLGCFQFFNRTVQWRKMLMQTMNHCRNCSPSIAGFVQTSWLTFIWKFSDPGQGANHVSAVVSLGVFIVALLSKAAEPPQAERRGIHQLVGAGDGPTRNKAELHSRKSDQWFHQVLSIPLRLIDLLTSTRRSQRTYGGSFTHP